MSKENYIMSQLIIFAFMAMLLSGCVVRFVDPGHIRVVSAVRPVVVHSHGGHHYHHKYKKVVKKKKLRCYSSHCH